jgi:hypothetical protein
VAGLSFFRPKPVSVDPGDMSDPRSLPLQDKLMMLGAIFRGDQQAAMQVPMMAAARAQSARQAGLEKEFSDYLGGQGASALPMRSATPPPEIAPSGPSLGPFCGPADARQGRRAERQAGHSAHSAQPGRKGPPTVRGALGLLQRMQAAGLPIKDSVEMLKAAQPNLTAFNDRMVDTADPNNINLELPQVDKGQQRVYDASGRPIGVMNQAGYVQAVADLEKAKTDAQERGKATYDLVDVPMADGSVVKMPRLTAVGRLTAGGGPGGSVPVTVGAGGGFGRSQTPGDKARAEADARAASERDFAAPKAYSGLQAQAAATDLVLSHLDRILGIGPDGKPTGKSMVTGGLGGTAGLNALLAGIPETGAHNLEAMMDPIKANIGFDKLAEMRANSPTGGALGQVSDKENKMLQSVYESLDQKQSPEQLRANLTRLRAELVKARDNRKAAFSRQYPNGTESPAQPAVGGGSPRITPEQARAELARRRAQAGR